MKNSKYPLPSHRSKTRKGTQPNDSKKEPIIGSGRNRPAKNYDSVLKTWNQEKKEQA